MSVWRRRSQDCVWYYETRRFVHRRLCHVGNATLDDQDIVNVLGRQHQPSMIDVLLSHRRRDVDVELNRHGVMNMRHVVNDAT